MPLRWFPTLERSSFLNSIMDGILPPTSNHCTLPYGTRIGKTPPSARSRPARPVEGCNPLGVVLLGDDDHAVRLAGRLPRAREDPDAADALERSFSHGLEARHPEVARRDRAAR